jgi:hypothetical protein
MAIRLDFELVSTAVVGVSPGLLIRFMIGRNTTGLKGVYCQRIFIGRIPSVTTTAEKPMTFKAMRTLYLPPPRSRNEPTDRGVVAIMAAPTRGTVLAGRYKILETIEAGTFRGHDLALDQTIMVRQASLKTHRIAEFWHQKAQQSVLTGDPHFLNVLDVVSENSKEFIIIEWFRGRSVGELLARQFPLPWADESTALRTAGLAARKNSVPFPQTREVIRKFDRDTGWVATAVLALVIFGAVGLAMQIKERRPTTTYPDNSLTPSNGLERSGGPSSGQTIPVRHDDMDHGLIKTFSEVDPSVEKEAPAPTSTTVSVLTFTKKQHNRKGNRGSWTLIQQEMRLKIPMAKFRSSVQPKIVDVKKRLVALWRASLARDEPMSGWNLSENSKSR